MRDRQRAFAGELERIIVSANDRGMLNSGVTQSEIASAIRVEYLRRARAAWGFLEDVLTALPARRRGSPSEWSRLVGQVVDSANVDLAAAQAKSDSLIPGARTGGLLAAARDEALEVVEAEMELYATTHRKPEGTSLAARIKRHPAVALIALASALLIGLVGLEGAVSTIGGWIAPFVPPVSRYMDEQAVEGLTPGAHLSRFESALGPFEFRTTYDDYVEYVFVRENCYVQAVTDEEARVLMYAVTVRNPDFHPGFRLPDDGSSPSPIVLGESKFADIITAPDSIRGVFGASFMHYMEFTRLPHSQDFLGVVLATNDAGEWWADEVGQSPPGDDRYPESLNDAIALNDVQAAAVRWYRESTTVNTYGESAPDFDPTTLFESDGSPKSALVVGPDRVMVQAGLDRR